MTTLVTLVLLTSPQLVESMECTSHPRINLRRFAGQVFSGSGWQGGAGHPLENVQIIVQRIGGPEKWAAPVSATTDEKGAFDFKGLGAGLYSVTIRTPPLGAGAYVPPLGQDRFVVALVKRQDWGNRVLYASLSLCARVCVRDKAGALLDRAPDCLDVYPEVVPDDRGRSAVGRNE